MNTILLRSWLLAALAPLLVVVGLAGLQSVAFVFAVYHVGLCLAVPALIARREGLSWREHARRLGLVSERTDERAQRILVSSLCLGGLFALAAPLAYLLVPDLFPDGEQLRMVLRSWGADPDRPMLLLAFLALVNGPAEELFWRGYLQDRLLRGPWSATCLVALFSCYHVLTVGRLAASPMAAALMLSGIVLAAGFWTWTRIRRRSVWPAILAHTGATLGYAAVCWHLLD